MAASYLENFAVEYGLAFEDNRVFGWRNGYFFTMYSHRGRIRLDLYMPPELTDPELTKQEEVALPENPCASILQVMVDSVSIFGMTKPKTFSDQRSIGIEFRDHAEDINKLANFLDHLLSKIMLIGIKPIKICRLCHKPMESNGIPIRCGRDVFPMHEECANYAVPNTHGRRDGNRSIILGIFGAAIGAALGIVLWLVFYGLGFSIRIVVAFIGVIVCFGYELLKGKQGKIMFFITIAFTALSIVIGNVIGINNLALQEYSTSETLRASINQTEFLRLFWPVFLKSESGTIWLYRNLGVNMALGLAGCIIICKGSYKHHIANRAKRLSASL